MLESGPRYRKFSIYLKRRFGSRVYRVGLCGGFSCPNRDGTLGEGGCTFCNPESSRPLGHLPGTPIARQLEEGMAYVRRRHRAERFIAYFSDYTTTHAEPQVLLPLYRAAISHPAVVGLALATRPDCLPAPVLELLEELVRETWLWVELGVQSASDETLSRVRRGHRVADSRWAIGALRERGISVTAHVIAGLPGEGRERLLRTARFLEGAEVDAVKLHNLHVVEGTPLARDYRAGRLRVLSLDEYVDLAVAFLEHTRPSTVVQRVSGEAPRHLTVAPEWSVNKLAVVDAVERALAERETWQGRALGAPRSELDRIPPRADDRLPPAAVRSRRVRRILE